MIALALATAALLSACAGSGSGGDASPSPSPTQAAPELAGTGWVLASYAGPAGDVEALPGSGASIVFGDDGSVAGSTGCNRFAGTFTQTGGELTVDLGPMTLMACTSEELTAQETAVTAGLAATRGVAAGADGAITLIDQAGGTVLTFSPGIAGLPGTSWRATGINDGRDAVTSDATTSAVTAEFGADGTLSGTGGCNTYSAPYRIEPVDGLSIGAIAATKMACDLPVMGTELAYFAALARVATYSIDGQTLTLRDDKGATQVTYTAQ